MSQELSKTALEIQWETIGNEIGNKSIQEVAEYLFFFFGGQIDTLVAAIKDSQKTVEEKIENRLKQPFVAISKNLSSETPGRLEIVELRRM